MTLSRILNTYREGKPIYSGLCSACLKIFLCPESNQQFCSASCMGKRYSVIYKRHLKRTCRNCAIVFSRTRSLIKQRHPLGYFCGRKCFAQFFKGRNNFAWKHGKDTVDRTYKWSFVNGGRIRTHRLVMQQKMGRALRRDEHVHHLNGKKHDNRPCNLAIVSPSEHIRMHRAALIRSVAR